MLKDPWVPCLADDLSDPMVVATTASGELRHGSVSGTLGFAELARAVGEGDFIFDYRGVAVANMDHANVDGRSSAISRNGAVRQRDRAVVTVDTTAVLAGAVPRHRASVQRH